MYTLGTNQLIFMCMLVGKEGVAWGGGGGGIFSGLDQFLPGPKPVFLFASLQSVKQHLPWPWLFFFFFFFFFFFDT